MAGILNIALLPTSVRPARQDRPTLACHLLQHDDSGPSRGSRSSPFRSLCFTLFAQSSHPLIPQRRRLSMRTRRLFSRASTRCPPDRAFWWNAQRRGRTGDSVRGSNPRIAAIRRKRSLGPGRPSLSSRSLSPRRDLLSGTRRPMDWVLIAISMGLDGLLPLPASIGPR